MRDVHELDTRVVHAIGARRGRLRQHLAAIAVREAEHLGGEGFALAGVEIRLAHLHELQSLLEPALEGGQHARRAHVARIGDRVLVRQRERGEHRCVRRQHRRDARRLERLPGDRLVFARMRLARPFQDPEKVEPHMTMGINVFAGDPWIDRAHIDAELLVQLPRERALGRLAGFDLAAREFPVAGVDLAGRSLREQKAAVGTLDHEVLQGRVLEHDLATDDVGERGLALVGSTKAHGHTGPGSDGTVAAEPVVAGRGTRGRSGLDLVRRAVAPVGGARGQQALGRVAIVLRPL